MNAGPCFVKGDGLLGPGFVETFFAKRGGLFDGFA